MNKVEEVAPPLTLLQRSKLMAQFADQLHAQLIESTQPEAAIKGLASEVFHHAGAIHDAVAKGATQTRTLPHGTNDCTRCGSVSPVYQPWPSCLDCGDPVCPRHTAPNTTTETDGETPETVICRDCDQETR